MVETGRPASMARAEREVAWLVFAREYAAMKWPHLAPNSRRNTARALTRATLALTTTDRGRPNDEQLRRALTSWAFNVAASTDRAPDDATRRAPAWLERNTRPVSDLGKPAVVRPLLDALSVTSEGTAAAPGTVQRLRGVVVNAAEYAVERRLLDPESTWRRARSAAFDPADVASPLGPRPYDLRHAAVSTWLNAGVPPTQVADWAGHSVAVPQQIYAKCLVSQEDAARRRIDAALRSA